MNILYIIFQLIFMFCFCFLFSFQFLFFGFLKQLFSVSLCHSLCYPGTQFVDQACLKLTDLPVSPSRMLGRIKKYVPQSLLSTKTFKNDLFVLFTYCISSICKVVEHFKMYLQRFYLLITLCSYSQPILNLVICFLDFCF